MKSSLFKKLRSSTHFRSILSPRPARDRVDDRSIVNIEAASNNKWPATRLRRFRSILKMPVINNTVSALLGIKCIRANESGRNAERESDASRRVATNHPDMHVARVFSRVTKLFRVIEREIYRRGIYFPRAFSRGVDCTS